MREGSAPLLASCSFSRPSGRSQAVRMAVGDEQSLNEAEDKWAGPQRRRLIMRRLACGQHAAALGMLTPMLAGHEGRYRPALHRAELGQLASALVSDAVAPSHSLSAAYRRPHSISYILQ